MYTCVYIYIYILCMGGFLLQPQVSMGRVLEVRALSVEGLRVCSLLLILRIYP